MIRVAALYVERGGPYFGRDDVDPWDIERDASKYDGPYPVVAHPPCGQWGSLRHLAVPNRERRNDKHYGPIAVEHVRRFGGVLEHPARSTLFRACGLPEPGLLVDRFGGFSLEVAQVEWGHVARKMTWLYVVGCERFAVTPPFPGRQPTHWVSGFRSSTGNTPKRYRTNGSAVPPGIKVCSAQQRRRTPPLFADWLIDIAAHASVRSAA